MGNDSGSHGQRVGYIRVSTVEQNNQRQKELLNASGKIDRFFEDKISGRTKTARPGLGECMAYVRDGDEGPDPRKVDTSGVSYAALVSVAEFSASKTSGAERLHQECRRRVL